MDLYYKATVKSCGQRKLEEIHDTFKQVKLYDKLGVCSLGSAFIWNIFISLDSLKLPQSTFWNANERFTKALVLISRAFYKRSILWRKQVLSGSDLRFSLIQSFSLSPGSSIQLARLSVSMEPSMACRENCSIRPSVSHVTCSECKRGVCKVKQNVCIMLTSPQTNYAGVQKGIITSELKAV